LALAVRVVALVPATRTLAVLAERTVVVLLAGRLVVLTEATPLVARVVERAAPVAVLAPVVDRCVRFGLDMTRSS